jgi:hypothetical protein
MGRRFVSALLAAALFTTACGGVVSPSQNQTRDLPGTLQPGGSALHTFDVTKNGEFTVTLASLTPPVNVFMVLLIGQVFQGQCIPFQQTNFAVVGRSALTGPINQGAYCVVIADQGGLTQAVTYSIRVSHP